MVVTMDTAAMSSGSSARNDPNTNARTAKAPAPPMRVSKSTPGPLASPPKESSDNPVTSVRYPVGSAEWRIPAARLEASAAVKFFGRGANR